MFAAICGIFFSWLPTTTPMFSYGSTQYVLTSSTRPSVVNRSDEWAISTVSSKTLSFLAGHGYAMNDELSGKRRDVCELRDLDRDVQECLEVLKAREWLYGKQKLLQPPRHGSFDEMKILHVLKTTLTIVCNAYWARLWVIQENILSGTSNTIIFNDAAVSFTVFSSLVAHICNTYKEDIPRQWENRRPTSDRAIGALDEPKGPMSQDGRHQINDNTPSTIDDWIVEILAFMTDPTRVSLITADFSPSPLSRSSELQRHEFLHLMQRVQTSLCSDRRDKIYGLRAFQRADDRFTIDYREDIYCLYFRACKYFDKVDEKARAFSVGARVMTIQAVSASLDLGLMDLVFGDSIGRTMFITTMEADGISTDVQKSDLTGPQLSLEGCMNVSFQCKHCRRFVTVENEESKPFDSCVIQCHRDLGGIQDDHYIIQVEGKQNGCRVQTATSWVSFGPRVPVFKLDVAESRLQYTHDQVLWLARLDDLFRRRYHQESPSGLVTSQTTTTSEPTPRGLEDRLVLTPGLQWDIYQRETTKQSFTASRILTRDDVKGFGLEDKAEEQLLRCLCDRPSSSQDNAAEGVFIDSPKWPLLFSEVVRQHLGDTISNGEWVEDLSLEKLSRGDEL